MTWMPKTALLLCALLLGPIAGSTPAQTPAPAPGPYYYMSDSINPNQFPWGENDRFGGVPIVENLTLLGTLLGDVAAATFPDVLVPRQSYAFTASNGNGRTISLQPFAYRTITATGTGPIRTLPLGPRLRDFLDDPLQGGRFDLTLPFLDRNVALSTRSASSRVERNADGTPKADNGQDVWHVAIDVDHNDDESTEFAIVAAADGIVAGNIVAGCEPGGSMALRHVASNGTEFLTIYSHLDPASLAHLPVGAAVARGQTIGRLLRSESGYAHLHFSVAVRGPAGVVDGKAVPAMWYTIDPFGVYDYRRGGTDYTYLPDNTLDALVQPVRHAYVFRTNPPSGSFVSGPAPVAALNQRVVALPGKRREITLRTVTARGLLPVITITKAPAHGTLVGTGPTVLYTPAIGFTGRDQFRYRAATSLGSADGIVTIDVRANRTPVAAAQTREPFANTTRQLALDGDDVDADLLTVMPGTAPLHGTLVYNGNIACYTPAPDYLGADSFTYRVTDGLATSSAKTVSLNVVNGFAVNAPRGAEGNSGTWLMPFIIRLLAPNPVDASVEYSTASETATSLDYGPQRGIRYFPAGGPTQATVWVTIKGDTRVEPDETFLLKLKNPLGGPRLYPSSTTAVGRGTIVNEDSPAGPQGEP